MAITQLAPPYPLFTDKNGDPLDAGYLYFGEANLNPETNPIQIYYDTALTQPAAQPVRTINGYPSRNGSAALIYADSNFSITVRNKRGELVIYSPVGYGIIPGTSATSTDQITYDQGGPGSAPRLLTSHLQDYVSVKDFGAVGDGLTDDTAAIQAAVDYCKTTDRTEGIPTTPVKNSVLFPAGTYLVSASLNITSYLNIVGAGRHTTFVKSAITNGDPVFSVEYSTSGLFQNYNVISNITINGQSNNCIGIYSARTNRFKAENVQVMQCRHGGISLYSGVINSFIDTSVWGCGDGTHAAILLDGPAANLGPNATTFHGGEVYASGGIGLHIKEAARVNVLNMTLQANASNAVLVSSGQGVRIDGCYFEQNLDDIKCLNTVNTVITNNFFALPSTGYNAFVVINRMTNGEIYNNEFALGKNAIGATTEIGSLLFDQSHVGNNFGSIPLPIDASILALAAGNGTVIERWNADLYGNAQYGRQIFMSRVHFADRVRFLDFNDWIDFVDSGAIWRTGPSIPEGVITAPVGSLYTNTIGGVGTTLYIKESGVGNTGWVAK